MMSYPVNVNSLIGWRRETDPLEGLSSRWDLWEYAVLRPGAVPGFATASVSVSDWTGDWGRLPVPSGGPALVDSRL